MNGCFDALQNVTSFRKVCFCDSDGCNSYSYQKDQKDTNGSSLKKVSLVLFSLVAMRFAFWNSTWHDTVVAFKSLRINPILKKKNLYFWPPHDLRTFVRFMIINCRLISIIMSYKNGLILSIEINELCWLFRIYFITLNHQNCLIFNIFHIFHDKKYQNYTASLIMFWSSLRSLENYSLFSIWNLAPKIQAV